MKINTDATEGSFVIYNIEVANIGLMIHFLMMDSFLSPSLSQYFIPW